MHLAAVQLHKGLDKGQSDAVALALRLTTARAEEALKYLGTRLGHDADAVVLYGEHHAVGTVGDGKHHVSALVGILIRIGYEIVQTHLYLLSVHLQQDGLLGQDGAEGDVLLVEQVVVVAGKVAYKIHHVYLLTLHHQLALVSLAEVYGLADELVYLHGAAVHGHKVSRRDAHYRLLAVNKLLQLGGNEKDGGAQFVRDAGEERHLGIVQLALALLLHLSQLHAVAHLQHSEVEAEAGIHHADDHQQPQRLRPPREIPRRENRNAKHGGTGPATRKVGAAHKKLISAGRHVGVADLASVGHLIPRFLHSLKVIREVERAGGAIFGHRIMYGEIVFMAAERHLSLAVAAKINGAALCHVQPSETDVLIERLGMQRHVVSKDQSFYGTEIITSSVIIAGTIIVCHRYGIVEVAAHERLVLRIIDVESVVGRKDHIAVARLHNARDDDTAQSVFCQSGEHLALRLVYAARRLITERHPYPALAVGIHIAHPVVGQTHAGRGHIVVLHGAKRAAVYLVDTVVVA